MFYLVVKSRDNAFCMSTNYMIKQVEMDTDQGHVARLELA